jgi:DNA-binding NarL/FixJ family response regulator
MRAATRLLVVDDHPLLCEGVQTVVDREPDIAVVGTAPDTDAAIDALRESSPRVVLMDVSAPESSAVEATRRVLAEDPDVSVLCASLHGDRRVVSAVLEAGASGYVLWSAEPDEVVRAIRAVASDQTYLSPAIAGDLVRGYMDHQKGQHIDGEPRLTNREREVLELIADGLGKGEIAARLSISPKTVSTHREHIMKKLDLHGDVALCKYAIRHGIVADVSLDEIA